MDILAIVTARGGSKGLPRKNILPLAGKPLIAWTIEAARQSQVATRLIVSTDSQEIADVSRAWGAEVPFLRPPELARDESPHIAVVLHALQWLEAQEGSRPARVLLLQPTAPLRSAEDIRGAVSLADRHVAAAVVSVCETAHHPFLAKRILEDGTLADSVAADGVSYLRRQALPPAYVLNGAIYLNRAESLLRDRTFVPKGARAYVMPVERSLDIDTAWDLHLAELILRNPMTGKVPAA
jgi:CMP-N-acetylneuraminic acid synthetase